MNYFYDFKRKSLIILYEEYYDTEEFLSIIPTKSARGWSNLCIIYV